MCSQSVSVGQLVSSFFLNFFNYKLFFFDVFLKLEHPEGFLSKDGDKRIVRVRVEENLNEVPLLFAKQFQLGLAFHPLGIPETQQGLTLSIFIGE
jgi:hypothetical protein